MRSGKGLNGESANLILATHWVFGYAHNGMLEILLQLGFVGLVAFLITFVQAARNAWACFRRERSIGVEWYTGILFLTLLYNIDEATVLFPNNLQSIMYVLACCGLALAANALPGASRRVYLAQRWCRNIHIMIRGFPSNEPGWE